MVPVLVLLCLFLSSAAQAQEKFFEGKLVLPSLKGYERYEMAKSGQKTNTAHVYDTTWSLEKPTKPEGKKHYFVHPDGDLSVLVTIVPRAPGRMPAKPFTVKEFDKHFHNFYARNRIRGMELSKKFPKVAGHPGGLYHLANKTEGSDIWLFGIFPPRKPEVAYFVVVGSAKGGKAKAVKLVNKILSGAKTP